MQMVKALCAALLLSVTMKSHLSLAESGSSAPISLVPSSVRQPLLVAFTEFPPYTYTNDEGVAGGFFIELMKSQLEYLGLEYNLLSRPTARIIHQLRTGEVDVWMGPRGVPFIQNDVREIALRDEDDFHIFLWRTPGTPNAPTVKDLENQTLAVINGFTYGGMIKEISDPNNKIRLHHTSSHINALKMLVSGRVDYLLDYEKPVEESRAKLRPAKLLKQPMLVLKMGFMVSTNVPYGHQLADALEGAVRAHYINADR